MPEHETGIQDPTALPLFATAPAVSAPLARSSVAVRLASAPANPSALPTHIDGLLPAGVDAFVAQLQPDRGSLSADGLDWGLVAAFRSQASDQLTSALGDERGRLDRETQQELGRSIIQELLQAAAAENLSAGRDSWSLADQVALAAAVFDALFGLGRFQPLVDNEEVENIEIDGCDSVLLEYADGTLVPGPAVAESDEELIDFLSFLASRSEVNARPFSEAQPRLHMRLDGGARLAATAWVTPRPAIVIRRHRLREVTLDDLVDNGTLSPVAATFLRAAVKAKKSIVVAGEQGAGKTTMVRALCAEIGPWERIGTFETEYELHLHELKEKHRRVVPWEARPGSGEVGMNGRQAGEITLEDLLYDSFRFNLSRQIVGEVRGREVIAMIKAMQSGAGSISTTHSADALGAIRKLITCAMEAGAHVTEAYATRAIAEHIDIVVQVHLETKPMTDGTARRSRWVSEILSISPGEKDRGYATTHVFRPAQGAPAVAGILPDYLRGLEEFGFDLQGYLREGQLQEEAS